MQNSENDVTFKIEKFGISRTAWRFFVLALFALLAIAGLFLSLTKGSLDIKVEQIIAILQSPQMDAESDYLEYKASAHDCRCFCWY